jgi:hypothetical protein
MLRRYGEKAVEESYARADELAAQDDLQWPGNMAPITDAVSQLTNTTPPRPLHRLPGNFVPQSDRSRPLTRSGLLLKTDFFEIAAAG